MKKPNLAAIREHLAKKEVAERATFAAEWPHQVRLDDRHYDWDDAAHESVFAANVIDWLSDREGVEYKVRKMVVGFKDPDAALEFRVRWT